jgi:hypothetical protein
MYMVKKSKTKAPKYQYLDLCVSAVVVACWDVNVTVKLRADVVYFVNIAFFSVTPHQQFKAYSSIFSRRFSLY